MTSPETVHAVTDLSSSEYLTGRLQQVFGSLRDTTPAELASLYAADVYFEDPSHGIQGRDALVRYFSSLLENVEQCRFRIHHSIGDGSNVFLTWSMHIKHNRLLAGDTIRVEGSSYLKTRNGQIYYHRDYYDMGALLYEHVPVLGKFVRELKDRVGKS